MNTRYGILAALLLLPCAAFAKPVELASARATTTTRFMPLSYSRDIPAQRTPGFMRSDRDAMAKGFMRIDRAQVAPRVQRYHTKPAEQPIEVAHINPAPELPIGRADTAVLELFGSNDATEAPEFQKAMQHIGSKASHAWPVPAVGKQKISSHYGHRQDPFSKRRAFHSGIDISAPAGTAVTASADGVIADVSSTKRFGKYVSVRHRDGSESMYGHLSAQYARVGQRVMQGQKIGAVGSTGRSTGAHLHYTLKQNGKTVDPMLAMNAPATVLSVAQR